MTKSLDSPSKILDRVIALATDVELARDAASAASSCHSDPVEDHVLVVKAERGLRKYLGQQQMSALRIVMLVNRVGTGQLLPEHFRDRFDNGQPKMTRLDHVVEELVSDRELSGHLAEGLSKLSERGIMLDRMPE